MSDYNTTANRLRWEGLATEYLGENPLYLEYVKRRLDPSFDPDPYISHLCAVLYGILKREDNTRDWIQEVESTARDYE